VNIALNRHQIENRSRKVPEFPPLLVRHISGHGKGLEINFRRHDGQAATEQCSTLQALNGAGKNQEIAIAGISESSAIAIRMLMQDVVSDSDMNCDRHRIPVS